ncbi:MAG: hypothetical protein ABIA47_02145 [bacterium]
MFDKALSKKQQHIDTMPFLAWLDTFVLTSDNLRLASEELERAEKKAPALKAYRTTPQSAEWHSEGWSVDSHIIRIIAGLMAVENGASLIQIDEFARHKHLKPEIDEIEQTIRENAATLMAFALVHDIGKPVTIWFDAPAGSKGDAEGFSQGRRGKRRHATQESMAKFLKLAKAFQTKRADLSNTDLCAKFYDEYEIKAHYSDHARIGASDQFLATREAVGEVYRLMQRDRRMLTWIVRHHMDAILFFREGPDRSRFDLLRARAHKAGFDADDALDLQLAALFLDATVGSLHYHEGVFSADFRPVMNFLLSEEMAAPERRKNRRAEAELRRKKRIKELLASAGLSADEVFDVLKIPFGPGRAGVMEQVIELALDPTLKIDFGEHTLEMTRHIQQAQLLIDRKGVA